jgi:hypothetical protein
MKIAIVNDIHVGKCLSHENKVRASSHLVEEMLQEFMHELARQHAPDILIHLGDLIRSENKESDLKRYQRALNSFSQFSFPVIHLLGNHELKEMRLEEIEQIWQENGFDQKSYGRRDIHGFTIIWLGLELDINNHRRRTVPQEQINWLKNQLNQIQNETILFTHCPVDDHNLEGNFFYEACDKKNKNSLFLENQAQVRDLIFSSNRVIAIVQAHLHYFHTKLIQGIPFITCPAMGDNICGPQMIDNVPEIYTILNCEKNRVTAKAYSGKFCFAGYESIPASI